MSLPKILIATACVAVVAGCSAPTETAQAPAISPPTSSSAPVKLTQAQELDKFCRVCVVDEGKKMPEYLPSRLNKTVDGKTYRFCAEKCRKEFDKNPKKYLAKK
jgi:YHS domain-containing protein